MNMPPWHRETANELHAMLSPELRAKIAPYERTAKVPRGTKLLLNGEHPEWLTMLNSGLVEVRLAGVRQSVSIEVTAGKVFGMRAVVSGELPQIDVTCVESSQVTFLPGDVFLTLLKTNPEVYVVVAKVLAADLQMANSILRNCSRRSVPGSRLRLVKSGLSPGK